MNYKLLDLPAYIFRQKVVEGTTKLFTENK